MKALNVARRFLPLVCLVVTVSLVALTVGCGGGVGKPWSGVFIKYSGNPILVRTPDAWDHYQVGTGCVIKAGDTYYLYYHGGREGSGHMEIGMATSGAPHGPWQKSALNPILSLGPEGAWDDSCVDRPRVVKFGETYYMYFEGQQRVENRPGGWPWRIGLATARSPEGPWVKHLANPMVDIGGPGEWDHTGIYLGSAVERDGRYYLWYSGFSGTLDQYGGIGLATAPRPDGPWTKYAGNPVLLPGPKGAWNWFGIQEPMVVYRDGLFHMWVAGNQGDDPWYSDIGYYYSRDGVQWLTSVDNPVLSRGGEGEWDHINVSEPFAYIEGDVIYLYYMGLTRPPEPIYTSSWGLATGRFR
ncbi:MAG: hypothetical protein AB1603_02215 [Chloroflexota bacterium]